jgi:1-acyl-sn-glycerol-3-phosphate acyltransferase
MQTIGSLVFTAFLFGWTFVYAFTFLFIAGFLTFPQRARLARGWAQAILVVLRWTCGLDHEVEGRERLPPGNHIALWKHSSTWETIAMNVIFPRQVWVLKRELQWIPAVGWALKLLHAIAIDRGSGRAAVSQVVEQGRGRLAEGDWIMIFPEGTRMALGETRRYGVSGALLAASAGKLVVPVAHNAGLYWPRRGLRKRSGRIRVVIGEPIACEGRDPRDINEQAQQWIESEVARLCETGPAEASRLDGGSNVEVRNR